MSTSSGWVYYGYNGFGERVRKTDANGNPLRQYSYYPGVDSPHSLKAGSAGALYYYALEMPGQVRGVVNGSGQMVNEYGYTPWGESTSKTEGVTNPLQYMARERDPSTGLYYVRNRWYDPETGRFLSEDPIGLSGGINLYAYAANSPVNLRDPLGLSPCCDSGPALLIDGFTGYGYDWRSLLAQIQILFRMAGVNGGSGGGPTPTSIAGSPPVGPGGGKADPTKSKRDYEKDCGADLVQAGANFVMTYTGLTIFKAAIEFRGAMQATSAWGAAGFMASGVLSMGVGVTATSIKKISGFVGGTDFGDEFSLTQTQRTLLRIGKALPYSNLAIDAIEAGYSCTMAAFSR